MIDEIAERGEYAASEKRMLKGVLDFGDQTAGQVLVPRPDMMCADADQSLGDALDVMLQEGFSRLPVIGEDRDDVVGVLYSKDLLPYLRHDGTDKPCRLVARPPFFVPESLPADELLQQLQDGRRQMAIVQDEFGGTAGLVTVEDLLEEIVGPIQDEYDEEIQKGKDKVQELNDRFADWYYIISDETYQKIHLSRQDIVKKKEKDEDSADDTVDDQPEAAGDTPAAFEGLKAGGLSED